MYHESAFSLRSQRSLLTSQPYLARDLESWGGSGVGYGSVLDLVVCPVDPIEAGAEFHEDSLEDRPRFALAYKESTICSILVILVCWLSGGLLWIFLRWFPALRFKFTRRRCRFVEATDIVVQTDDKSEHHVRLSRILLCREVAQKLDNWPPVCPACLGIRGELQQPPPAPPNLAQITFRPPNSSQSSTTTTRSRSSAKSSTIQNSAIYCSCSLTQHGVRETFINRTRAGTGTGEAGKEGEEVGSSELTTVIVFSFRLTKYYLNLWNNSFEVAQFESQLTPKAIHEKLGRGIQTRLEYESWRSLFGSASTEIKPSSLCELWIQELSHPFYVFQLLCVIKWLCDDYAQYALPILAITLLASHYDLASAQAAEAKIAALSKTPTQQKAVTVFRPFLAPPCSSPPTSPIYGNEKLLAERELEVSVDDLTPGDLFEVKVGMRVPCDALIVWGGAVVSEAMLTGEVTPTVKMALPLSLRARAGVHCDHSDVGSAPDEGGCSAEGLGSREGIFIDESSSSSESSSDDEALSTTYKIDQDTVCSLFASTSVLSLTPPRGSAGGRVLAVAVRTQFMSRHGRLIRSLVHPTRTRFKFNDEAISYVKALFEVSLIAFLITLFLNLRIFKFSVKASILKSLDLFTDSIPPALPAVLSIGIAIAVQKLQAESIDCVNLGRVNLAGQVATFVFDKTGTLTEQGLTLSGCLVVLNVRFPNAVPTRGRSNAARGLDAVFAKTRRAATPAPNTRAALLPRPASRTRLEQPRGTPAPPQTPTFSEKLTSPAQVPRFLQYALATCHNMTLINGNPVGDTVDALGIQFVNWTLCSQDDATLSLYDCVGETPTIVKPPTDSASADAGVGSSGVGSSGVGCSELGVVRRFAFSAALQRMTVIARDPDSQELFVFCKGSPEVISDLCQMRSLPVDFHETVMSYTHRGFRLICVAGKPLGRLSGRAVSRLSRAEAETKLLLLGCLVFNNRLKKDTKSAMAALQSSPLNCKCIIATGDGPSTALAVARDCRLVKSLESASGKDVIMGDLYIPHGGEGVARVGQRSYFVWVKLERRRTPFNSETLQPFNTSALSIREEGDRLSLMQRMLKAHSQKLTTFDLRDFLRGKNPRNFEFVLTGRAFRKLRMLHEELGLKWFMQRNNSRPTPSPSNPIAITAWLRSALLKRSAARKISRTSEIPLLQEPQPNSCLIPVAEPLEGSGTFTAGDLSFRRRSATSGLAANRGTTPGSQLNALIGRFSLEPYADPVAASIIFGSPPAPARPRFSTAPPTRSSWITSVSSAQHPNAAALRLTAATAHGPAPAPLGVGKRRPKPVRNAVGPPAQAIRAALAGMISAKFPFLQQTQHSGPPVRSPRSKRRKKELPTPAEEDRHAPSQFNRVGLATVLPTEKRDVFWLLDHCKLAGFRLRQKIDAQGDDLFGNGIFELADREEGVGSPAVSLLPEALVVGGGQIRAEVWSSIVDAVRIFSSKFRRASLGSGVVSTSKKGRETPPSTTETLSSCEKLRSGSGNFPSLNKTPISRALRRFQPQLPTPLEEGCSPSSPPPRSEAPDVVQTLPLALVSYAESQALGQAAASLHFHPEFAFPTRSSYAGPPSHSRLPGLSQVVPPYDWSGKRSTVLSSHSHSSRGGICCSSSVASTSSYLSALRKTHTELFPATSRLAHKGLIPATNSELMLLTVVVKTADQNPKIPSSTSSCHTTTLPVSAPAPPTVEKKYSYELIRMSLFEFLLRRTKVYAHMSPEDKISLVSSLKGLPGARAIGMCGDGENDCGALKSADVGISLSDALLVAPFLVRNKSVNSCVKVVKEGGASLKRAFRVFKFIIFYSIIQFSSAFLLFLQGLDFTDYQYVWVDFLIVLPLFFFVAEEVDSDSSALPSANLCSRSVLGALTIQCLNAIFYMIVLLIGIRFTPGWHPFPVSKAAGEGGGTELASYENTSIFILTTFQYLLICCVSVSRGSWVRRRQGGHSLDWLYFLKHHGILFQLWLLATSGTTLGFLLLNRPSIVSFPSVTQPSPPLKQIPWSDLFANGVTFGSLLKSAFLIMDRWLILVQLPWPAKCLVLLLIILHWISALLIENYLIDEWKREDKKLNFKNQYQEDSIIPPSNAFTNVYHVL